MATITASTTLTVTSYGRVATTAGTAAGANDLALRVTALRGGAVDGTYQALVTRIGTSVSEAQRQESNAQVLAY